MASLLQNPIRVGLRSVSSASVSRTAGIAGITAGARHVSQVSLPDLPYDFGALEPAISGQIMETHYTKHHQTYVNNYNATIERLAEAQAKGDVQGTVALQAAVNFNGGGHVNHSLFWENLAPKSAGGGAPPEGKLAAAIAAKYGSYERFVEQFNGALAGIQGSGWAWLVQEKATGEIGIKTYANQDPVVGAYAPLLGVDAWEHAYYLQYQNRKAEYFKAIWEVINWKAAEKRFQ